jgi:hypothetical protein
MIQILQLAAIGLLTVLLGAGYAVAGHIWLALSCLVLGLAWAAVDWFGFSRTRIEQKNQKIRRGGDPFMDNLAILLFFGLATWGLWLRLPGWLMLFVVLLAITGWDLGRFSYRMLAVTDVNTGRRLERIHITRLGITLAAGLVLGIITLLVHVSLDFIWILILGFLAMIALNRFTRGLSN